MFVENQVAINSRCSDSNYLNVTLTTPEEKRIYARVVNTNNQAVIPLQRYGYSVRSVPFLG